MADPRHKEVDIREEMRIALWWRSLIGDSEYTKFDPDDMLRWYMALELRGPDEIRALVTERHWGGKPVQLVHGIVGVAPHPPFWLINTWLEHHESRIHTALPWGLTGAFVLLTLVFVSNMGGCANLHTPNTLVMHPPMTAATVAPYTLAPPAQSGGSPSGTSGAVQPGAPGITSPVSGGIAGAAAGVSAPTGATGPTNGGVSAGVSH